MYGLMITSESIKITGGAQIFGRHVAWATKFYTVAPNICGSSVWHLPRVTILKTGILRWLVNFWNYLCTP